MKTIITLSLALQLLVLGACSSDTKSQPNPATAIGSEEGAVASDGASTGASTGEIAPAGKTANGNGSPDAQSNSLTAGEFNDALNIDVFLDFLQEDQYPLGYPANSALNSQLTREDWLTLVPARPTTAATKLEVALVLDVTGSMGDELAYLQAEWNAILNNLQSLHPSLSFRLSLVAYRDVGDRFVTASQAFTEDRAAFQNELMKYRAEGGGDYPEAVDLALRDANQMVWGDASSTKLLFWLADAPPHEDKEAATFSEILQLRAKGVSIYPIAASGVAARAEEVMRVGALITGGSYLFLTDDSGLGNSHAKPHVPCYNVERLNQLLLRILAERISGQRMTPKPEDILRKVGSMQDGVCLPAATPTE